MSLRPQITISCDGTHSFGNLQFVGARVVCTHVIIQFTCLLISLVGSYLCLMARLHLHRIEIHPRFILAFSDNYGKVLQHVSAPIMRAVYFGNICCSVKDKTSTSRYCWVSKHFCCSARRASQSKCWNLHLMIASSSLPDYSVSVLVLVSDVLPPVRCAQVGPINIWA